MDQELLEIDESNWEHGEVQDDSCRDAFFAILFLLQFGVIATFSIMGVASAGSLVIPLNPFDDDSQAIEFSQLILFATSLIGSVIALSMATMLILLGPLSQMMIQISLVMSPLTNLLASVSCLLFGQVFPAIILLTAFLIGVCYAASVWHRVPFAAANVNTAMAALKENKGLFALSPVMLLIAAAWILVWGVSYVHITIQGKEWFYECQNSSDDNCGMSAIGKVTFCALLLSLYWTSQVIKNCFHTTIAGVVGTWWFTPEEERSTGFCNNAIYESWMRSNIYSFGSICLGSLLVAILQVLQAIIRMSRNNNRNANGGIFLCLLQCLFNLLEKFVEYVNKWAFVYIALYGYDYCTSGKKVFELFKSRGWSVIINDHLVSCSLGFMQFWIGVLSGAMGIVLGLVFSLNPFIGGIFGFVVGLILSSILFSVVNSALDTVMVCFAESPNNLRLNHPPEISQRLMETWKVAYPNECGW